MFNINVNSDYSNLHRLNSFNKFNKFEKNSIFNNVSDFDNSYDKNQDLEAGVSLKSKYNVNGVIDEFQQGVINDCWLLGGIKSFSYSEKGSKILKDAIKNNDDGTYTVSFKALGFDITLSDKDLDKARKSNEYSSGDDDVLLLEVSIQKAFEKVKNENIDVPDSLYEHITDSDNTIDYGSFRDLAYIFTGEIADVYQTKYDDFDDVMSYIADDVNNGNTLATCVFQGENNGYDPLVVRDVNGEKVTLTPYSSHLFAIKEINDDNVIIINPYDSEEEITLSRKVFNSNAQGISFIDV